MERRDSEWEDLRKERAEDMSWCRMLAREVAGYGAYYDVWGSPDSTRFILADGCGNLLLVADITEVWHDVEDLARVLAGRVAQSPASCWVRSPYLV